MTNALDDVSTQVAGLTHSLGADAQALATNALQRRVYTHQSIANYAAVNANLLATPVLTCPTGKAVKVRSFQYTLSGAGTNQAADALNYRTFALNKYYANGTVAFTCATGNWSNLAVTTMAPYSFTLSTNASNLVCAAGESLGFTTNVAQTANTTNALFPGVFTLMVEEYTP